MLFLTLILDSGLKCTPTPDQKKLKRPSKSSHKKYIELSYVYMYDVCMYRSVNKNNRASRFLNKQSKNQRSGNKRFMSISSSLAKKMIKGVKKAKTDKSLNKSLNNDSLYFET